MFRSLAVLALAALSAAQGIDTYNAKSDGLSSHTIYMPKGSGKVPVLVWSSGGCMKDGGRQHLPALQELTAHGVMIIAMGVLSGAGKGGKGKGRYVDLEKRQNGMGANIALQTEAFGWLEKNAGKGKYARVDLERVGVAGQSCGGLESYNAAKNKLVKVLGIFNSGMFGDTPVVKGMKLPTFYFLGGSSDIAYAQGEADFKRLPKSTPTWKGNLPVGHMATYSQPKGGKFGVAMWKWLDWTLRGNTSSAAFFTGTGAGTAKGDGWTTESRALDGLKTTPIG